MEFDRDRLAKLAGIRGDEAPTQGAQPVRTSESGIIREGRTAPRSSESADVSRLREIIRAETRSMIAEARAQRSAAESGDLQRIQGRRSLREAAAMGFYGPGFAGSPRPVLGGPMSSSGRLAWLTEAEAAPADAGAEPIEINSGNIGEILKGLGIDVDPQAVLKALENPTDEVKDVAREVKPEAREAAEEIKTGLQESAASGYARGVIWGVLAPLGVEALNAAGITGERTSGDMHETAAVFAAAGAIVALSTYGIVKLNKYFSKK
jgi:hypothetical protein